MNSDPRPAPTIDQVGYSWDKVSNMSRLGLVFFGINVEEVDGEIDNAVSFTIVEDSPIGRAKELAHINGYDVLETCFEDARDLPYDLFVEKYPSLAPFAE